MNDSILRFRVKLLEDLHTGSGEGRLGIVDDTQSVDGSGRWPIIRDSTFQGVLREAGDLWLHLRQQAGQDVVTHRKLLNQLLGRPGNETGLAVVGSLRFTEDCKRKFPPGESPYILWTSTSREVHSRSPEESTMRTVEFVRAGSVFEGAITLPVNKVFDQNKLHEAETLLKNCLKRIPAIGGGKTRGWGAVRITFLEPAEKTEPSTTLPIDEVEENAVRLRLLLRNLEPLNLAATANPGNIVECQSYLTGGRIRGSLLTWISSRGERKLASRLSDPDRLEVGNGYLVPESMIDNDHWKQTRVLPVPLTIRQPKSIATPAMNFNEISPWWVDPHVVSDRFGDQNEWDELAPTPDAKPENERIKAEDYLASDVVDGTPIWRRVRPANHSNAQPRADATAPRTRCQTGEWQSAGKTSPGGDSRRGVI